MPERSFGRTIKYRRSKLGLSQAKLGELVGRSQTAVRAWERDQAFPKEASVITALSAILGVDEQQLFEKAGQAVPARETSSTIEQALATLAPGSAASAGPKEPELPAPVAPPPIESVEQPAVKTTMAARPPRIPADRSYLEDRSQRQLYRVRALATLVALVALGVALLWAIGEGTGALGQWWDGFFGSLRL